MFSFNSLLLYWYPATKRTHTHTPFQMLLEHLTWSIWPRLMCGHGARDADAAPASCSGGIGAPGAPGKHWWELGQRTLLPFACEHALLPSGLLPFLHLAVGQNQWYNFGVGECTAHFRTYFSGWIESDVHWGLTGILTHGHFFWVRVPIPLNSTNKNMVPWFPDGLGASEHVSFLPLGLKRNLTTDL